MKISKWLFFVIFVSDALAGHQDLDPNSTPVTETIKISPKFFMSISLFYLTTFTLIYLILGPCCKEVQKEISEGDIGRLTQQYDSENSPKNTEKNSPKNNLENSLKNSPKNSLKNSPKNDLENSQKMMELQGAPSVKNEDDESSGEDVEVIIKRKEERGVDDDGNEVIREVVSHVIFWGDGTEEERPGLPGDEFEGCIDE